MLSLLYGPTLTSIRDYWKNHSFDFGVSGRDVGRRWPAAGLGALSVAVPAWDLLKEVHYLHYLHLSLAPGQITGREHSPTLQQKIGLKIY